ncbi:MAG: SRPBCC family protein [Actinomycetota bacterium]|nr:SRPBCC family protein [Actinomycetota bacterium]
MRYRRTIEIASPPEDVFAFVTDLDNLSRWQSTVREVRWDGELHQGSEFEETRELLGRRARSRLEVAVLDPPHEFAIRVVEGPVQLSVRHLFEPSGDGTRLTLEAEGRVGRLMRLAAPIAERAAALQASQDLERLKRLIEEAR